MLPNATGHPGPIDGEMGNSGAAAEKLSFFEH